ncbi:hypothetical protein ACFL3H_10595, partial [Gemmatimonadota bacterium]
AGMSACEVTGGAARFHPAGSPPPPEPDILDRMEELYKRARKPMLAVGLSATRFDIHSLIMKIAEQGRIPIVLTPMAKGMVPEDHPSMP